jgi:hypothetical protein
MTTTFDFIRDSWERQMVENGYQAIQELELWDWLKTYESDKYGFMCSTDDIILQISEKMQSLPNRPNHSGASFGHSMRILQFIAKEGFERYKQDSVS